MKQEEITQAQCQEDAAVEALEACWDSLCAHAFPSSDKEFDELVKQWSPFREMDPLTSPVDLLSPLGQERREVSHTEVLRYLLDPAGGHDLGDGPLQAFLDLVMRLHATRGKGEAAAAAFEDRVADCTTCTVLSERAAAIQADNAGEYSHMRTDLWLEIPDQTPQAIIVIENKIDDVAREGQLAQYDRAIARRVSQLRESPHVTKIYLTPGGDAPPEEAGGEGWICCGYGTLALSLSTVLGDASKPGAHFLRLYLATVVQKLGGLRWKEQLSRSERYEVSRYLKMRLRSMS